SFEQEALNLLGGPAPVEDSRLRLRSRYEFAPGCITRTDEYTPTQALEVRELSLEFLSFSAGAHSAGLTTTFEQGRVQRFEVEGPFNHCSVEATRDSAGFKSPSGPMTTHVHCSTGAFTLEHTVRLKWSIRYG
ncbi:MAG TPA: hypothetical protein VGE47_04295, partial [Burkholderiaceae bacterium]